MRNKKSHFFYQEMSNTHFIIYKHYYGVVKMKKKTQEEKEREMEKILEQEMGWEMNEDKDTDNCKVVVEEFAKRGLPEASINPKEDVFTYKKWQSLGRQVKKGEKGVKISWLAPMGKDDEEGKRCRWLTRSVFHITQTEEIKKAA